MPSWRRLNERRLTKKQVAGLLTAGAIPLEELSQIILGPSSQLEISYAGLDVASQYIDDVGCERAQREIYDHLVAYVGEVIRVRTEGRWMMAMGTEPYPYIAASEHSPIMPVNVLWSEVSGLDRANLRREAANEVRRARAKY